MRRTITATIALGVALSVGAAGGAQAPARSHIEIVRTRAAAPAWFTPSFAERVIAAGRVGVPLPQEAKVPMSSLAFTGIRPGQQIIITNSSDLLSSDYFALCSANHVFRNGSTTTSATTKTTTTKTTAGKSTTGKSTRTAPSKGGKGGGGGSTGSSTFAIGTAGHCGKVGEKVFMIFAPLGVVYIGDIVKSTFSENRLAPDFALIAIKPELNAWVSPSMAHWGGPTGANTSTSIAPIVHSGHGLVVGTGGTPRAAVAYRWVGDEYRFEGAINKGDSGSGANTALGLAVGNITHIAIDTREGVPVWMGGTHIKAIQGLVGSWQLATCSLPVVWPAPGCPPV